MSELKNLSAILEGGAVPAGYNGKAIGKLSKTYLKLENRKVVNLYPIRTVMHEDSRYCLYACPLKGTEIDEATLQSIKAEVDTLEIGEIRYDSVQSCGYDYYIVDPSTKQSRANVRMAITSSFLEAAMNLLNCGKLGSDM